MMFIVFNDLPLNPFSMHNIYECFAVLCHSNIIKLLYPFHTKNQFCLTKLFIKLQQYKKTLYISINYLIINGSLVSKLSYNLKSNP